MPQDENTHPTMTATADAMPRMGLDLKSIAANAARAATQRMAVANVTPPPANAAGNRPDDELVLGDGCIVVFGRSDGHLFSRFRVVVPDSCSSWPDPSERRR